MTYLGAGEVTIRPVGVHGGYLRPFGVDVKRVWYDESQSASFMILHRADVPQFEGAAIASFGPPSTTLHYEEYVAWVWQADIMRFLPRFERTSHITSRGNSRHKARSRPEGLP